MRNNNTNNQQVATDQPTLEQTLRAELAKTKLQLAKQSKQSDLYKSSLTDFATKTNSLTKEQLDELYDPQDPQSVQKAIDAHNEKLKQQMDSLFSDIEANANTYVETTYKQENLELADRLAMFNKENGTQLTAEQLEDDIPPKILKQYKDNEAELFKASTEYLNKLKGTQTSTQQYHPQTPQTPNGAASTVQPNEGVDDDDEMY